MQENTDQRILRIWTLFTQWILIKVESNFSNRCVPNFILSQIFQETFSLHTVSTCFDLFWHGTSMVDSKRNIFWKCYQEKIQEKILRRVGRPWCQSSKNFSFILNVFSLWGNSLLCSPSRLSYYNFEIFPKWKWLWQFKRDCFKQQ